MAFGDRVKHWITFNETVVFCGLGYLAGAHPPAIVGDINKYFQATHNVFLAHAKAIEVYKSLKQYGEIGITHVFSPVFSIDEKEDNILAAKHANELELNWFYDPILKGEYPKYVVDNLTKNGINIDWSDEELEIIKNARIKMIL